MIRVDFAVILYRHRSALDERQQITLHAFLRHFAISSSAAVRRARTANLVDLVDKHNAVILRQFHSLVRQIVITEIFFQFLLHQNLLCFFNGILLLLRFLRHSRFSAGRRKYQIRICTESTSQKRRQVMLANHIDLHLHLIQCAIAQLLFPVFELRRIVQFTHKRRQYNLIDCRFEFAPQFVFFAFLDQSGCVSHQILNDGVYVLAHIAHLGKLGRLHFDKRRVR
mmetsp:Transcript_15569/g.24588  ORF Transcript_15569/g.24588 Transcript_15569/m.24588 type:complete len:225 (+) Transcript_15569:583-1257(+)